MVRVFQWAGHRVASTRTGARAGSRSSSRNPAATRGPPGPRSATPPCTARFAPDRPAPHLAGWGRWAATTATAAVGRVTGAVLPSRHGSYRWRTAHQHRDPATSISGLEEHLRQRLVMRTWHIHRKRRQIRRRGEARSAGASVDGAVDLQLMLERIGHLGRQPARHRARSLTHPRLRVSWCRADVHHVRRLDLDGVPADAGPPRWTSHRAQALPGGARGWSCPTLPMLLPCMCLPEDARDRIPATAGIGVCDLMCPGSSSAPACSCVQGGRAFVAIAVIRCVCHDRAVDGRAGVA